MGRQQLINSRASQHLPWVDVLKGVGIVFVVVGHAIDPTEKITRLIFLFHMPLFFCISGYLYKPLPVKRYCKKKAKSLLIPYITFLCLLAIPLYVDYGIRLFSRPPQSNLNEIATFTCNLLYGGMRMRISVFGVFWFVSSLFLTQQIYNLIFQQVKEMNVLLFFIISSMYMLALFDSPGIQYPYAVNTVLIAIVFFYFGHLDSGQVKHKYYPCRVIGSLMVIILGITFQSLDIFDLKFSMNVTKYGVPFFSVILALSFVVILKEFAITVCKYRQLRWAEYIFSEFGKASLVIMFLHLAVKNILVSNRFFNNEYCIGLMGLLLPLLAYKCFIKYDVTRKYCLGIVKRSK